MSDNLPAKPSIGMDESGLLKPKNLEEAFRLADAYCKSGLLPKSYDTAAKVLTAMQFALELGLRPLTAMRQIAVVNGTPSVFGDLPLAMVRASGQLESMREYWTDKDMNEISPANKNLTALAFAAVCVVKRRGDPEIIETFFTMSEAEKAGLMKNPVWTSYPKRMLRYRARSQALKDKFADVLNGIAIAEYDHNITQDQLIDMEATVGGTFEAKPKEQSANEYEEKLKRKKEAGNTVDAEVV